MLLHWKRAPAIIIYCQCIYHQDMLISLSSCPTPHAKRRNTHTVWQTKVFSIQRGHFLKLPNACICTTHTCIHVYTHAPTHTDVHMYPPTHVHVYPPLHRHFFPLHGSVKTSLRTRVWKSLTSSTNPSLETGSLTCSAGTVPAVPARRQEGVECSIFLMAFDY